MVGSLISSSVDAYPNYPISFFPKEYTKPEEVRNKTWELEHDI